MSDVKRDPVAGLALLVAAAWFLAGCAVGITHSPEVVSFTDVRGIEFAPDSARFAVGVQVDEFHPPNELGAFPDGGIPLYVKRSFDILVYDLRRRRGPTRVASLSRGPDEDCQLDRWAAPSIIVSSTRRGARGISYRAVNPASGRVETLGTSDPRLKTPWGRLHPGTSIWENLRTTHVEEACREFSLWRPALRRGEFLFALPLAHDGHRDLASPYLGGLRARNLRVAAVHRIWDAQAVERADSLRVAIETYVPRPGTREREYQVLGTWGVPSAAGGRSDGRPEGITLPERRVRLAPVPTRVEVAYAMRDLVAHFHAHGAADAGPRDMDVPWLTIRLKPVPGSDEDTTFAPGIWAGQSLPISVERSAGSQGARGLRRR